jgi:hypothetical protein
MARRRNPSRRNPSKAVYIGTGIVVAAAVLYFMTKKDETTVTTDANGTTTTVAADGTTTVVAVDGTTAITTPDGTTVATTPDGTQTTTAPDGTTTTKTGTGGGNRRQAGKAAVAEVLVVYLDGARAKVSAAEANDLAASGYFFYNSLGTALIERATSSSTGAGLSFGSRGKLPGKVTVYAQSGTTAVDRANAREAVASGYFQWNADRTSITEKSLLTRSAGASTSGRGMSF